MTKNQIWSILNDAKATHCYAKFELTNNKYIMISYHWDNTVEVSTNSRDMELYNQMQYLRNNFYQNAAADYVFLWINKMNRLL